MRSHDLTISYAKIVFIMVTCLSAISIAQNTQNLKSNGKSGTQTDKAIDEELMDIEDSAIISPTEVSQKAVPEPTNQLKQESQKANATTEDITKEPQLDQLSDEEQTMLDLSDENRPTVGEEIKENVEGSSLRDFPEVTKPIKKPSKASALPLVPPMASPIKPSVNSSVGSSTATNSNEVSQSNGSVYKTSNVGKILRNDKGKEEIIKIQHPASAKGLIRINKDQSYQYSVPTLKKSKAASFAVSMITSPKISTVPASGVTVDYNTMYGGGSIYGLIGNYEWMPFRSFGSIGLVLETGLGIGHGKGTLVSGGQVLPAQESYTLVVVPMSAFLKYRLDYWKRQWLVPYIEGGITYYGLSELRVDNSTPKFAGSSAAGGGGGIQLNLTKFDPRGSFTLAREYGVADLWLNFEARTMVGLKKSMDFTNTTLNFGIVADY